MIGGNGGVLDNDATMEGDMFHDQGSAVIMKAHSHVEYTPIAISKSWIKNPVQYCNTTRKEAGPSSSKEQRHCHPHSKDRVVCFGEM